MIIVDYRRKSPAILFSLSIFMVSFNYFFVRYINPGERTSTLVSCIIFIITFNILYIMIRAMTRSRGMYSITYHKKDSNIDGSSMEYLLFFQILFVVNILSVLGYLWIFDFSIQEILLRDWNESIGVIGLAISFLFTLAFCSLAPFLLLKKRWYLLISLIIVLLVMLTFRSRSLAISALAPFLLILLFIKPENSSRTLRLILLTILGCFGYFGYFLLQQIRYQGALTSLVDLDVNELFINTMSQMSSRNQGVGISELEIPYGFVWAMINAEYATFAGNFNTFIRMLTFYLPSSIKPVDTTKSLALAFGWSDGSYHPTVYGLAYLDGLTLGVVFGLVLGAIFNLLDKICTILRVRHITLMTSYWGIYSVFALLAARGSLSNAWISLIVASFLFFALLFFIKVSVKNA